ncbi:hypothetical protein UFOVP256_42 [uncultured Caudovirales phage]|uniref:Uncharacterized protein n=1 Tax=uncultured Caudovirales phage TaxID=2100421 RepID=A0A6J5LEM5_9CAUD|nr:hypothetical protein UFOVP256_42 [uncultured Caudovirales phage]
MQLDTVLRKAVFLGFIAMTIFNILLVYQCKIYSERVEKTKIAYNQIVFELESKLHARSK